MSDGKRREEIKDKASYFVADLLSDLAVENEEEVQLLLSIIETCTFHIQQILEGEGT